MFNRLLPIALALFAGCETQGNVGPTGPQPVQWQAISPPRLQDANAPIKRYTAKETVLSYFGGGLCLFGILALFLGHETAGLALIIQASASLMTGAACRAERLADALGVRVVD